MRIVISTASAHFPRPGAIPRTFPALITSYAVDPPRSGSGTGTEGQAQPCVSVSPGDLPRLLVVLPSRAGLEPEEPVCWACLGRWCAR